MVASPIAEVNLLKMEALKAISLPPGFGFHPTDVELISHYLKRKNQGLKVDLEVIPELAIYEYEPWDLPACCQIPTRDNKWHFFTPRYRKYRNGVQANRATKAGYWKSTGKDRNIRSHNRAIGTKKTLVFHEGRAPYGKRTDWIMHEYLMDEKECKTCSGMKDTYVLCRVTKRNDFTIEGENASVQTEEADDCQNTVNDLHASLQESVIQEESNQFGITENLDEWFEELFDPDFDGSICFNSSLLAKESKNEPQVSHTGLNTSIPKDEPLDFNFLPEELLELLHDDSTTKPKINELLTVNHNGTSSSIHLSKSGAESFNKEMLDLSKSTKFTAIQVQERRGIPPAIGTSQQSVKLQVQTNKMESRSSASVSQTIKFAHIDHQINSNSKPRWAFNVKGEKKRELIHHGIKELLTMVRRFLSCV